MTNLSIIIKSIQISGETAYFGGDHSFFTGEVACLAFPKPFLFSREDTHFFQKALGVPSKVFFIN